MKLRKTNSPIYEVITVVNNAFNAGYKLGKTEGCSTPVTDHQLKAVLKKQIENAVKKLLEEDQDV